MSALGALQALWRRALTPSLRRRAAPAVTAATQAYVRASVRRPGTSAPGEGIKLVGYFGEASGIAASAGLAARAFEALGVPVERVDIGAAGRLDFSKALAGPTAAGAWIFHLNPPELLAALACLGPKQVIGPRYGYWAWELPKAPSRWKKDAALLDEVWAPSRFTADSLLGAAAPVRVVPHPLFLEDYAKVRAAPRRAAFQGVSVFDFRSSLARKNPQGAIAAWAEAFGDDPAAELTMKTQNGAEYPEALAELRAGAPGNVRIVDEVWPYEAVKRLIAGADVLISLHRAEGFGLAPAEALALGTPVLATGWSGVMDFLDVDSALLIPSTQVKVKDPQAIYPAGQSWAEPDLAAAVEGLKRLRDEPTLRRALVRAGRERVKKRLSPQAWFETLPETVRRAALAARRP
jgi:glycosyltransferase involved in cell wall biosynthesis